MIEHEHLHDSISTRGKLKGVCNIDARIRGVARNRNLTGLVFIVGEWEECRWGKDSLPSVVPLA